MTQTTDLEQRLRAVESSGLPSMEKGVTTCWYRNPDGPEAADEIARLRAESEALREALAFIADAPDPGEEKERSATFYRIHAGMLKQVAAKGLGRETVSQEAMDWAEKWANSPEGQAALKGSRHE